jgi:hypothetical protein
MDGGIADGIDSVAGRLSVGTGEGQGRIQDDSGLLALEFGMRFCHLVQWEDGLWEELGKRR